MKNDTNKGWTRRAALSAGGLGVLGGAASCAPKIEARSNVPVNGSFSMVLPLVIHYRIR